MTKSSKLIATLGVVAGITVAAFPLGVFATQTQQTVTGTVQVDVEVQPAIAMTITGNNDDHSHYNDGSTSYAEVDNFAPSSIAGSTFDTHTVPGTAVTGVSSAYLSITPNTLIEGDRSAGTPANDFGSTINVYTNSQGGYTLKVKANSSAALTNVTNSSYTIPAASGTLTAGAAGWTYDVTRHGSTESSTFTPTEAGETEELAAQQMSTTDAEIDNWTNVTSGGRDTIVDYNVATDDDQATGVYTTTLTYTATTR